MEGNDRSWLGSLNENSAENKRNNVDAAAAAAKRLCLDTNLQNGELRLFYFSISKNDLN